MSRNLSDTIVSQSRLKRCCDSFFRDDYASFSHFFMKLFFAAPESGLPSLLTALPSHASALHFLTKLVFAAPTSGLPSLLIALLSQVAWAIADPTAKHMIKAAKIIRFTFPSICTTDTQEKIMVTAMGIRPLGPGSPKFNSLNKTHWCDEINHSDPLEASGSAFDITIEADLLLCGAARQQITHLAEQLHVSRNFGWCGRLGLFRFFQLVDATNGHEQHESNDHEVHRYSQKLTVTEDCSLLFRVRIGETQLHLCRQRRIRI